MRRRRSSSSRYLALRNSPKNELIMRLKPVCLPTTNITKNWVKQIQTLVCTNRNLPATNLQSSTEMTDLTSPPTLSLTALSKHQLLHQPSTFSHLPHPLNKEMQLLTETSVGEFKVTIKFVSIIVFVIVLLNFCST